MRIEDRAIGQAEDLPQAAYSNHLRDLIDLPSFVTYILSRNYRDKSWDGRQSEAGQ
jgi:hypothetical protein